MLETSATGENSNTQGTSAVGSVVTQGGVAGSGLSSVQTSGRASGDGSTRSARARMDAFGENNVGVQSEIGAGSVRSMQTAGASASFNTFGAPEGSVLNAILKSSGRSTRTGASSSANSDAFGTGLVELNGDATGAAEGKPDGSSIASSNTRLVIPPTTK